MKTLFENTWAELDRGVRIFLLVGQKTALLIDTGATGLDAAALTAAHTRLPLRLLNTHADPDHIAGNGRFAECLMHPSEAAHYRERGGGGRLRPVFGGDVIDLGNRELEIVHLPGHTPGSVAVLDRRNRCLIGGDPIQADGDIYMFGPQRNFEAYIAGLERLTQRTDFDRVYPSHATECVDRAVIPALIDGAKRILSGEIRGEATERHGRRVRVCDVGAARFLCDAAGTEA